MINILMTAEKKGLLEYDYFAFYGIGNGNFPKTDRGVWIVGRNNKSCDSLVEQIVDDIGNQRYNILIGDGMKTDDEERIRKYITYLRKKS